MRLPNAKLFVTLSHGRSHYRIVGPEHGTPVLLLHGATVPGWEFDRIAPKLNAAGFRTIAPDFFGHGYSDRPRTRYDYALFVQQICETLDRLAITGPVCIIGHSLGAAVGARFASNHSHRVSSLILTAPLLDYVAVQPAIRVLSLPILGELLIQSYVIPMLKRRRSKSYSAIDSGRFATMFRDQFRVPGFGRALLSLMRSGSLGNQSECYAALDRTGLPTLIIRGYDDKIFSAEHLKRVTELLPRSDVHRLPGMGHPLMLTHPEILAPLVIQRLEQFNLRNRSDSQTPKAD